MTSDDRRRSGFKDRTRLEAAVGRLLEAIEPHDRTERLPLNMADGRAVATTITAPNNVPNYDRAAMDGFAVRAAALPGTLPVAGTVAAGDGNCDPS